METLTFILNAADWLASAEAQVTADADPALAGKLALAAAHLEHQSTMEMPGETLRTPLLEAAKDIPPQWAMLDSKEPFAFWLQVATLAEHRGALRLSLLMLGEIERVLREASQDHAFTIERVALCWARRGRIARTMGDLDHAVDWYDDARRAVRKTPSRDAYPQAVLGLAAVALNRGNVPRAARLLPPLLRPATTQPELYRIPAHQLMAVVRRRQRRYTDAMLHVWAAFDMLTLSDFRREQLIATVAEIALDAGDVDAAARGFETVLQSDVVAFVRVPALWGAIQARLAQTAALGRKVQQEDDRLQRYFEEVQALKARKLAPASEIMVHLSDATFALARGDKPTALTALEHADRVAKQASYFERQFLIDELRAKVKPDNAEGTLPTLETHGASTDDGRHTRHPALRRLLLLR